MKCISWVLGLLALLASSSILLADPPVDVPDGVHYKAAPDSVNDQEKATFLSAVATGGDPSKLFGQACIIAPGYWKTLSSRADVKFTGSIPSHFQVPQPDGTTKVFTGGTLKVDSDFAILAGQVAKDVGTAPTLRKLTREELIALWTLVPFDLEEPIFMVENGKAQLVVLFTRNKVTEKLEITWIDDLKNY